MRTKWAGAGCSPFRRHHFRACQCSVYLLQVSHPPCCLLLPTAHLVELLLQRPRFRFAPRRSMMRGTDVPLQLKRPIGCLFPCYFESLELRLQMPTLELFALQLGAGGMSGIHQPSADNGGRTAFHELPVSPWFGPWGWFWTTLGRARGRAVEFGTMDPGSLGGRVERWCSPPYRRAGHE